VPPFDAVEIDLGYVFGSRGELTCTDVAPLGPSRHAGKDSRHSRLAVGPLAVRWAEEVDCKSTIPGRIAVRRRLSARSMVLA
jgi:hypothetical protein